MPSYSLEQLTEILDAYLGNGQSRGDPPEVVGITDMHHLRENYLCYLEKKYFSDALFSQGNCFLIHEKDLSRVPPDYQGALLVSPKAKLSWIRALELFDPYPTKQLPIVTSSDLVKTPDKVRGASNAQIGPHCLFGPEVELGQGVVLMGNNYLGPDVKVGAGSILHPGVVLEAGTVVGKAVVIHANTVIGSDGFGYEASDEGLVKIPHIGNVEIGDGVEIGSNVSVDRGTLGSTIIGPGCKIDNLVQIAHNVRIGPYGIFSSQAGVAGSSRLGTGVILAGQAGVADHVELGDGVIVTAQSGVPSQARIEAKQMLGGSPALPMVQHNRIQAILRKLPEIYKGLKAK